MRGVRTELGFSLVEVVIALAIFSVAVVPVLCVAMSAERLSRAQPEATDLQQRMRVVMDKLQRDLAMAGAGPSQSGLNRSLSAFLAPVVPHRTGLRSPDPELSAFSDRVSVIYVPDDGPGATLSAAMADASASLAIDADAAGCP